MQHHFEILEYAKARQHDLRLGAADRRCADALRGDAPSRLGAVARRTAGRLGTWLGERRILVRRLS